MIFFKSQQRDGRTIYFLGLNNRNLAKLQNGEPLMIPPRGVPAVEKGKERMSQLPFDIMIAYERNYAEMIRKLRDDTSLLSAEEADGLLAAIAAMGMDL